MTQKLYLFNILQLKYPFYFNFAAGNAVVLLYG